MQDARAQDPLLQPGGAALLPDGRPDVLHLIGQWVAASRGDDRASGYVEAADLGTGLLLLNVDSTGDGRRTRIVHWSHVRAVGIDPDSLRDLADGSEP